MSKIFVCFIGSDGSGKSTLAENVFVNTRKKGIKVKKAYGRHKPIFMKFANSVGIRLFFKNNDMFSDYNKYLREKKIFYKKTSKLVHIYTYLLIIEYYFQVLLKIIIPYKLGHSIIS